MKIKITPEKYINAPAPSLTKGMMDWFYSQFDKLFIRNIRIDGEELTKINTMNVRINQSYLGSSSRHFYVSINGSEEFYLKYQLGFEEFDSYFTFQGKVDKSGYFRYDWLVNLTRRGVDVGTDKPTIRYNDRLDEIKKQKRIRREKTQKESRYKLYLELREEFKNIEREKTINDLS